MAGFSQDGSGSETQQWSQNSPWMSWSQPQFGLHGPSLGSRNFNNFQLFNDEDVEVIGTQMPQHVDGNKDMSMRGETKDMTRKYDDIGKKRGRAVTTKSKVAQKKSKSRRSGVGRFGR
jgi:hypothetical protein